MAPDTQSTDFTATFSSVGLALAFLFDSAPSRSEDAGGEILSAAIRRVDFDGENEEEDDEEDEDDLDAEEEDDFDDEEEEDDYDDEDDEEEDDDEDEDEDLDDDEKESGEDELNLI